MKHQIESALSSVDLTKRPVSFEQINAVAQGARVRLDKTKELLDRIEKGARLFSEGWKKGQRIYGVTTGYGDSVVQDVDPALIPDLPLNLLRFHGCGMGNYFDQPTTRAILVVRLLSLLHGASGVRWEVIQRLLDFLNRDLLPLIPQEGSVGASGDLTPLSYIAGLMVGERDCLYKGEQVSGQEGLHLAGLKAIRFEPKEVLALMNGTSVMTALACLVLSQVHSLVRLSCKITSLAVLGSLGNPAHFDERIFLLKPHPGQKLIAAVISKDLGTYDSSTGTQLQDRYSLRCAPHVIGVVADALPFMRKIIETELNSANDNPLVDLEQEEFLHGGNFYGGHIAFAMDSLKPAMANLAGLMDRQVAMLVDIKTNRGLPPNLTGTIGRDRTFSHGLKAVQIGLSSMTAEAMKLTLPASVFSRSTECHNQDIVSMGTHAARDAVRILELTTQCAAFALFSAVQAVRFRVLNSELTLKKVGKTLTNLMDKVNKIIPFLEQDRALESELRSLTAAIKNGELTSDDIIEP